ncbi:MAG: GNAT family N-acetyltransferase [Clostridia bacterium]|nr:GNAT family N-acetyltransferase [Clostridia bacterium]
MTSFNITFEYLKKADFSTVSSVIFNILADNMEKIAPTENTREEDYKCWYEGVSNGLKRDERQIILIKDVDSIIGFFQYYINNDTFMMEEIQFKIEYQGSGIFRQLYAFLIENIRNDLEYVEAYANVNNQKSIAILKKLGLQTIGMNKNGNSYHFRGKYSDLIKWYKYG